MYTRAMPLLPSPSCDLSVGCFSSVTAALNGLPHKIRNGFHQNEREIEAGGGDSILPPRTDKRGSGVNFRVRRSLGLYSPDAYLTTAVNII